MTDIRLQRMAPTEAMRRLYHEAFPPEERREWSLIVSLAADPASRFAVDIVLAADGSEAGFLTSWDFGSFRYVEHFAVDPTLRGGGLGAKALAAFAAQACTPVVLEVEPAATGEMARRRIGFYTRNGFMLHDSHHYVQPPYSPELPEVELCLMSTAPVDLDEVTRTLHSEVYGVRPAEPRKGQPGAGLAVVLLAAASLALGSCANRTESADDAGVGPVIVAANEPLRAIAADVAGPDWTVTSLLSPGSEPETFDPTIATLREASGATLAVMSGVSLSERKLFERLIATGHNLPTINVAERIDLITDTHGGTAPDPHLWLSTQNLAAMTRSIASGLVKADPDNAESYASRADSIAARYEALGAVLKAEIDSLAPGAAFVVNHPSLSYFAREFGLEQIALGQEHKEMSAKGMVETISRIAGRHPKVYFVESAADSARAMTIAVDAGLPVVVLPTNSGSPAAAIRAAVNAIIGE